MHDDLQILEDLVVHNDLLVLRKKSVHSNS